MVSIDRKRRHALGRRRDEQRPEHDQCGEVTVYEQVRDAPEGYAAEARVTRDPRDAIDRQLVIDHPIRLGRRGIHRPAADYREEECEKNQHKREIPQRMPITIQNRCSFS